MKTTKEMIEVMQAYDRGEAVQLKSPDNWLDVCCPSWNWNENDYRVKPKTKITEIHWVLFEKDGKIYTSNPRSPIEHREFKKDILDSGAKILRTYCEYFEVPLGE